MRRGGLPRVEGIVLCPDLLAWKRPVQGELGVPLVSSLPGVLVEHITTK
jgi:hypothetical protein